MGSANAHFVMHVHTQANLFFNPKEHRSGAMEGMGEAVTEEGKPQVFNWNSWEPNGNYSP